MFIRLLSVCAILSFGATLPSNCKEPIKCGSLNNQPYINSDGTLFYPFYC